MSPIKLRLKAGNDGVRVREQAETGKPIGQVYLADVVDCDEPLEDIRRKLGVDKQWLKVTTPGGVVGYIAAWLFESVEPLPAAALPEAFVEAKAATQPSKPQSAPQPTTTPSASTPASGKQLLVRTIKNGVRIRAKAVDGDVLRESMLGDVFISLDDEAGLRAKVGAQDAWLKVKTIDGIEGFAAAWLLERYDGPLPEYKPVPEAANLLGMNLDIFHPLGSPDPARLKGLGWVRFLFNVSLNPDIPDKPENSKQRYGNTDINAAFNRYKPHLEKYAKAGFKVLLVFTHQTYGEGRDEFWPWKNMTTTKWQKLTAQFAPMVGQIAAKFKGTGIVHAYQIWNEMDAPQGAEASVPIPPADYGYLLAETIKAVKQADPNALCISGGHTSGPERGSQYARETIKAMGSVRPDGLAFHPYGRGITQKKEPYAIYGHIDDEMNAYLPVLPGKAVWITEFGVLNRPGDKGKDIYTYAGDLVKYMKLKYSGKVAGMMWYAWAMSMHNGYGIVGSNDQPIKDLYDDFLKL